MQERLCCWKAQDVDCLLQFYSLIRDEICEGIIRLGEEGQLRNAFQQVWNVTPLPKEKTREAVPGPSASHSSLASQESEAEFAAAVEEGILEAAKQASLEIRTERARRVNSWLEATDS